MSSIRVCRLFSNMESFVVRWGVGLIRIDRLRERMIFSWCLISGVKYRGDEVL